jgi:hypothetical protein
LAVRGKGFPHQAQSFGVTVEAGGTTKSCTDPVTYYKPCRIFDVPEGKAIVKVTGDSTFARDIKVEGEGRTRVVLARRGYSYEIVTGIMAAAGGGAVVYGLTDSNGFQGTGHVLDIVLVTIGGTFLFIGGLGLVSGLVTPHDMMSVQSPAQAPHDAAWRCAEPGTLRF